MLRIAHIVKPMAAKPGSEHAIAQPITFETMRRAKAAAKDVVEVEHWATGFPDEQSVIPSDFQATTPLRRSACDIGTFRIPRPLPVFHDVLERLYAASQAEYFIYTNVDIGLQPHFCDVDPDTLARTAQTVERMLERRINCPRTSSIAARVRRA